MTSLFLYELTQHRIRTLKTAFITLVFVGQGIVIAGLGPALLDLQLLTGTTIEKVALLLPARSVGFVVGSVIGSIASDLIDHQKVIIFSIIVALISLSLVALFKSIVVMYCIILILGIASGSIDTVLVIHIWGKANPPFVQIVHFAYGLGAFIAPFIVEPFLLNKDTERDVVAVSETVTQFALLDSNSTKELASNSTGLNSSADDVMIHWSFIIGSVYYLVVLLFFVPVYVLYPENTIHPSRIKSDQEDDSMAKRDAFHLNKPLPKHLRIFVVVISMIAMHAYCGLEISFGSLLSPYAVHSKVQMSKSEGSFLTSGYWGTFTFSRVFSLIGILILSPRLLLLIKFTIIMISNGILMPFGNVHRSALWFGTCLMGFGNSGVYAIILAFIEQLTPVTGRITAGFSISACTGELVIPTIVTAYLKETPQVFLWVVLAYSSLSLLGVLVLMVFQHFLLKFQRNEVIEMKRSESVY